MLKHYIEVVYPGVIFGESTIVEIPERKDETVELPDNAYGYRFMDREETEDGDEILKGNYKNISGWRYIGKKMTLQDVQREFPNEEILISNMEVNDIKFIVWTDFKQAIPLYAGDEVIDRNGKK